ncbi:hypothetical protein AB0G74_19345 [Streptomyces sp. NPDC020875]|uniref:hypothetical protein n=1 Tax=Streptomyces sp. NPDC020875 TaxID=3154898 RepID=UPI0034009072
MQGDVSPPDPAGTTGPHGREGPRHAAPRKSLLSKLQTPTGKVIALAAMPTAVLMGMGLTPRLAIADDRIPYAPGPCVTRSDEPPPGEKPTPGPSGTAEPSETAEPAETPSPGPSSAPDPTPGEPEEAGEGGTGEKPGSQGDVGGTGVPDGAVTQEGAVRKQAAAPPSVRPSVRPTARASASPPPGPGVAPAKAPAGPPAPAPAPAAKAKPSPGKTYDPWDPLGLGDAIRDLLDPDDADEPEDPDDTEDPDDIEGPDDTDPDETTAPPAAKPKPNPTPKPKPDPTATGPDAGQRPKPGTTQRPAAKDPAPRPAGSGEDGGATDRTKKSITDAARRVGADVEELDEAAKGLEPRPDTDIPDGAVPRFPCPEADPEALAAAKEESGIPGLPDDPWTLESTRLTLRGLDYHGIVQVRTAGGRLKPALKFTASSLDIKDLHQLTVATTDRTMHARARPGSTSTIRDGTVTMYTEELKGDLFGIIPVTFSPATPPPLNIPFAFFTDVTLRQAGQFGGTLTIPGLRNYLTDDDASS